MEGASDDGAGPPPAAAEDRGSNAPPPPPPSPDDEANGGGHRRAQRRPRRRRVRVRALGVMMAAAAYMLLAEALSGETPPAPWMFTAFVLWILGKGLLLLSYMN